MENLTQSIVEKILIAITRNSDSIKTHANKEMLLACKENTEEKEKCIFI